MNIQQFLESKGYKMWKEDHNSHGSTFNFQKRVDRDYPMAPLCQCNEKLFINIDMHTLFTNSVEQHTSFTISLVHENQQGEWADLRIYSLSEEQIQSKLESYEDKIINLWEIFCE